MICVRSLVLPLALAMSATGSLGCRSESERSPRETVALAKPDRSWVRLDGTVVHANDDAFELDYGDGVITVEMDDWDWVKEGRPIQVNNKVIVYGHIDRDLHRRQAVEASAVYVEGLGTTFFASAADEEALGVWPQTNVELGRIAVSGVIASIKGKLVDLDTGAAGNVTIDVSQLSYDPLDDEGFQRLKLGHRIRVVGRLMSAYFASRSLVAERIVSDRQLGRRPG